MKKLIITTAEIYKKVCSNEQCFAHAKKIKCDENVLFCKYCGHKLYNVCSYKDCYEEVVDSTSNFCQKHLDEKTNKQNNKNIEFDTETLNNEINARSDEAKELLNDVDKMESFLERLEKKIKKVPVLGDKLSMVPVLISLVRSYVKKEYTDIPFASILCIVAGLLYIFSPIDLIPDNIPFVGYMDDVAVINFILTIIEDDLEDYKKWQEENDKRILD